MMLVVLAGLIWGLLTSYPRDVANDLPLPNEKAYTNKVNQWLIEKRQAYDIELKTKTPEKHAREEVFWTRLISTAEAAVKDILFYGKIVDQHGDPVPGVVVKYKAQSQYLAAGTGFGETMTDGDGCFNTKGAEGVGLSIREFIKPGYQFTGIEEFDNFQRFENSVLWRDFTKEKPFVFKAWKVNQYPSVNVGETTFGFDLGVFYSMDFTAASVNRVKQRGVLDLDLQVIIDHDESGWKVKLLVPNGGLIETEDYFLNLAPEDGYQKEVTLRGAKEKYVEISKKYYIHSRGRVYGSLQTNIRPYHKNTSAIRFHYVMNLENGRDLVVARQK